MSEPEDNDIYFYLPDRATMLARLNRVNSSAHLNEYFYPKLLEEAGTEVMVVKVVLIITVAIQHYSRPLQPSMTTLLLDQMDDWIDALVPDAEFAARAKAFYAGPTLDN